ncbi:hypothetical protein STEG23_007255 [Scotinomys teguina]
MTVTPLGWDQDCSLKIRESDVPVPWFLDPGSWSKTVTVRLFFIFPGICTLSLSVSKHWGSETRWPWGRPYVARVQGEWIARARQEGADSRDRSSGCRLAKHTSSSVPASLCAAMDTLVEDDICILNHEKAHRRETATPHSVYSGEESVASHFALVTAYEDIKKRLKDSEKENSLLKKRIRALEEKLVGARVDEETSSVGREQVNKAYHAYREVCIDRDNLKNKLEKINKDNTESLKVLNEQLQSKEVELLQLRTEVETQQVGDIKVLSDKAVLQSWTDNERLIPNDGTDFQEHNSYGRNSLEDNSWVFPSPPKSSETAFGENKSKTFPLANLPPLHYLDQHNQNCLYKS